jgi:putative tryptophan/tyrosine transport system substrate-binding protein
VNKFGRRQFLIAAAASLIPQVSAIAQHPAKVHRVGALAFRSPSTPANPEPFYDGLMRGMRELGYIDGKNVIIEWRFADSKQERLAAIAAELVRTNAEVIVTHSTPATHALALATTTIPIVTVVNNPVESGFTRSLSHPGGNITGMSAVSTDLAQKHLELLKTLMPKASRVGILVNPDNASHASIVKNLQTSARKVGMTAVAFNANSDSDLEQQFALLKKERIDALTLLTDPYFNGRLQRISQFALKYKVPLNYTLREYVEAGGLISYGQNFTDFYRRSATYVDRILKGAKPGDLPFQQPTTLDLSVNLKAAKAIGLVIPQELLIRADLVIE